MVKDLRVPSHRVQNDKFDKGYEAIRWDRDKEDRKKGQKEKGDK